MTTITNNKLTGLGENHPANGPLTTERLTHVRDVLHRNLKYSNGGSMDYIIADAVKAIDELLEGRKAEPVAWSAKDVRNGDQLLYSLIDDVNAALSDNQWLEITSLYTAPPAPVVPDECPVEIRDLLASHSDALFHDGDAQEIWNACRAAMLNKDKNNG
ncbi:TPA: hypothetical protein ACTYIV_001492 [Citrobacter koseri]|nr:MULTISPECIES: hypothetical protein [Citrobacter]MDM2980630.1 hypothetical protein [Citrobacter sp. CK197]SQB64892.1 Uncharacterised protein [Citrobacter koseri]